MKVLIITASLNERSGWGRYSSAIVKELTSDDVDVSVCAEDAGDPSFVVGKLEPGHSPISFFRNIRMVRRAAYGVDLVHALDGWPYGIYGWCAVLGTRRKLFISGIGTYSVAALYTRAKGALLRRAYARARYVFCISDYTKRQIAKAGIQEEKLIVVHMGVSSLPVLSQKEYGSYRKTYGIVDSSRPVVLTVGSIKDRKGQFDTLKAIELLKQKHPNILYIALGSVDEGYVSDMKRYASAHDLNANMRIVTGADDRALSFFYSRCDIFALNSNTDEVHHHFEGFGLVVVEAYQFGKPAVGSKDSGIEDAIQDGITGFLTKQGDPADIAAKIERILEKYDIYSRNAKMRHADFTWRKTVEAYTHWYSI
jgi:glycosyltransferase involved in cell wall biosynthesis